MQLASSYESVQLSVFEPGCTCIIVGFLPSDSKQKYIDNYHEPLDPAANKDCVNSKDPLVFWLDQKVPKLAADAIKE
jgi:hypothetical protein